MRVPDRPSAELDGYDADSRRTGWDHHGRPGDLADRLRRLAPLHPSADMPDGRIGYGVHPDDVGGYDEDFDGGDLGDADLGDADLGDADLGDADLGDADLDYIAGDDLGLDGGMAADKSADDLAAPGLRSRQAADVAGPGSPGDGAREPYRPWFMADGSSEPWFAAKQAE